MNFLPLDTTQSKRSPVRRITAPKTAKTGTRNNYNKSPKSNKNPSSTNESNHFYKSIRNEEINPSNNETRSIYSSHTSTQDAPFSSKQEDDQEKEELISYWTERAVVQNSDLSNPKISCKIKPEILPDLIKNLQSVRDACIIEGRAELSRRADAAVTACKNLYKENLINEASYNQSQNIQKRIDQARQELSELQERITVQEANMANEFQEQNRKLKEKHKKEIKSLQNEWYVEDTKVQEPNYDDGSYLDNNYYDSMYPTAVNKNFKSAKNSDKYSIYGDEDREDIYANKKTNNNYDDFFDNECMDDFVKKTIDDNHTSKNINSENADLDNSTKNESNIKSNKRHKKIKKKKSKKTNSEMKNRENNELNNAINNFADNLLEMQNEDNQSVNSATDESDLENKISDDSQIEDDDSNTNKNDLSTKVSNAFIKLSKDDDESENKETKNDDESEIKKTKSEDENNDDDDIKNEDDKSVNNSVTVDDDYSKATDESDLKTENKKSDDSQDDDDNNEASKNDLSSKVSNAFIKLNKDESENSEDDKDASIDDVDSEQSENKSISNESDISDHSNKDDDNQSDIQSDSEIMDDESSIINSESHNVDEHSKSYNDEISHEGNSTFLGDEKDNEIENEISDVHSSKQSISTNKNDEFDNKSKNSNSIKNDKIFKRFFSDVYEPDFKSNSKKEINVDDSINTPKMNDNHSIESESLNSYSKKEINYNYGDQNNNVNEETESKNNQSNSSSKPPQAKDKKPKQKRNITSSEIINAPITHVVNRSQLNNRVDLNSSNYKKERRLRHYNKTSTELRNLRRQAAFLLSENKDDEARIIQQRADAIEKEEILSSSLQMRQDYEKSLESLIKKQQEEEENLKKLQNIKRTKYENAKKEGIGVLQRRIEKLENEMKTASNKERANALFQRSSNLQKSSLGSRSKLKSNRNDFTSEEKMANIKESEEEYFYDDYDQHFNHHHYQNANHQSHEMNDFSYESNEEFNSIENQKLDMNHSLNRNAKRKPIDRSGLNRYNYYTFASKINKSASQNLNQNLNQSLKEQIDLNVNKSLDLMNQRHPLAKRRKIPTAVSMPLTSRRQVKPGEFSRLELPPLNASKEAKKIIKDVEKSMRLNKDYI